MSRPNLLNTKKGRLFTFFCLYLTEGIPQGFTNVVLATQMRRQGVSPAAIGVFTAALNLPWAWKWAIGPFVDTLHWNKVGRRKLWIVGAQIMMVTTLMICMPFEFTLQMKLFTTLFLIHNIFAATNDVAIDALACDVLHEDERGSANGLMFGAAHTGNLMGGAGVLFLTSFLPGNTPFLLVGAIMITLTVFITMLVREPAPPPHAVSDKPGIAAALGEVKTYLTTAFRAMFGSRPAFAGVIFALLPGGAMALSAALASNLGVEIGMTDTQLGTLGVWSGSVWIISCIVGGILSDRFGRRKCIAIYMACTVIPTFFLAIVMYKIGWIMPIDMTMADRPIAPKTLFVAFWSAGIVFSVFQGLMYGTRTALFMDITTSAVAATQFTAYMALLNVTISYSALWQGQAIVRWGYPTTLVIDGCLGLICLSVLPFMGKPKAKDPPPEQDSTP